MRQAPINETWFQGAVSFERGDRWLRPWRLWHDQIELFHDQNFIARAGDAAGVRLRLATDSPRVGLALGEIASDDEPVFDLTIGGQLQESQTVSRDADEVVFAGLPGEPTVVEIWLPQFATVSVRGVLVDKGRDAAPAADDRPRWVTYGSSITQAKQAVSPSRTWSATAARRRNVHLTCLGYAGQCHLEPVMGRVIRDLPAHGISLKLGINAGGSLSERTFLPAAVGLVLTIREKHPTTPLVLVGPILSPPRETTPMPAGLTLEQMRQQLIDVVKRFQSRGDENIHYLDGRELFGQELTDAGCLPDELHPNAAGQEIMGANAATKLLPMLGL